jgi:predicted  nucleic acid-binding Zn-ribbon protein
MVIQTPEERELAKKQAELSSLKERLVEEELDLATLQTGTRAFEARYCSIVGRLFAELDELHARKAEAEALTRMPHDCEFLTAPSGRAAPDGATRCVYLPMVA